MRATWCLAALFIVASCTVAQTPSEGGGAGTSAAGSSSTAAGASSTGAATAAGGSVPNFAGSDNGGLLGDSAVPFDPDAAGGAGGTQGEAPEGGPPGDGNSAISTIRGSASGTATFTQEGTDVTLVIDLTSCPSGDLAIRIHDGYACDNAETEGEVWGVRGDGIGGPSSVISCNNGSAALTYTREGSDPETNWTVADQNLDTDVTAHVLVVTPAGDPADRIACGNFF